MSVQIDSMLVRSPDVCGGRLRIDGTRVTVLQIASLHKQGEQPEEIAAHFPHVKLAHIYTALAWYHANKDEVEAELKQEQLEADSLRKQFEKPS